MADGIFEKLTLCTWTVGDFVIPLGISRIEEEGGNRIVENERPLRDGAKLDDTGAKAKRYRLTGDIFNGSFEPGIPEANYPDTLLRLIQSFDVHETGDLMVPTRGIRRCRASSYTTTEASEVRDAAAFTLTFIEDNEDGVTASSFTAPSARSALRSQVEVATFSADAKGVHLGDFFGSFSEMASEIEGLLNSPSEYASQLDSKIKSFDASCDRIERAGTGRDGRVTGPASALLSPPESAPVLRQMRTMRDGLARAVDDQMSRKSAPRPMVYGSRMSVFDIATLTSTDAVDIMSLNPRIPDFFEIPAGTTVLVPGG